MPKVSKRFKREAKREVERLRSGRTSEYMSWTHGPKGNLDMYTSRIKLPASQYPGLEWIYVNIFTRFGEDSWNGAIVLKRRGKPKGGTSSIFRNVKGMHAAMKRASQAIDREKQQWRGHAGDAVRTSGRGRMAEELPPSSVFKLMTVASQKGLRAEQQVDQWKKALEAASAPFWNVAQQTRGNRDADQASKYMTQAKRDLDAVQESIGMAVTAMSKARKNVGK